MASRAELKQICEELKIDCNDSSIEEMKKEIRKEADKIFNDKEKLISADLLSLTMRKFLTKEYDYVIVDKKGKKLEYDYLEKE